MQGGATIGLIRYIRWRIGLIYYWFSLFFNKMRTSKDAYLSILSDAHYWTIVKDAVEIGKERRTFEEAYAEYGDDWEFFPYRYTLTVDPKRLSEAFFHSDHHVSVVIKQ